ncbi:MAG: alanine--tRNA ligase, partial [Phycisphaerales bacterium]|nr:alanine--tRNA ligase [Phycisphaerales bacterium]MCB9864392.1 alanine--tRNA ligase [Phycisphaerales bacterium]
MPTGTEIRQQFIDFFTEKCGHTFVPSSPCVPHDDPTLMFANAGMNQFKPIFLGQQAPDVDKWPGVKPGMPTRAANSQKCIRAGGKHNDLDDVGHDTYHHTFFEMLGNWSFGDYFKKEAIEWAWELLTKVWGIDGKRLHATYFEGDSAEGLEPDNEARDLWLKILPPERVHPGNKKDNFWEMGDTGPCGPCSEIHIDLTPDKSGAKLVNGGDARVIEIWNLVFIQFNRANDGKLSPLPAKHVDTGMGFERVSAVLQGMQAGKLGQFSNYDTDIFTEIFNAIRDVTGAPKYTGLLEDGADGKASDAVMRDITYRVIADHIRTLTFALTDGAVPSNEGRGYVLRRILRRAVRYGRQFLGMKEPFLYKLVPVVANAMAGAFPELTAAHGGKNPERVAEIVRDEEASFVKTLDRGIALFETAADYATKHHHGRISGEDAFKMHDTFGFPIDLTELMAEERGLTVNIGEYERLMEEARERARTGGKDEVDLFAVAKGVEGCEDSAKYSIPASCKSQIRGFTRMKHPDDPGSVGQGQEIIFWTSQTCFYAEQGGQTYDTGLVTTNAGRIRVDRVDRRGELILHKGTVVEGEILPLSDCEMAVDMNRRAPIMSNHTATHILNLALRNTLGDHVQQKGSLVDPDKTRFDLSHNAAISVDELTRIEKIVNEQIEEDLPVHTEPEADQKQARTINTLRAVFGEKYPDKVRVVSIGVPYKEMLQDPNNKEWMNYSVEFCGGTHVGATGEIAAFCLVEESAVAKGIRRVIGITGDKAIQARQNASALKQQVEDLREASDDALPDLLLKLDDDLSRT